MSRALIVGEPMVELIDASGATEVRFGGDALNVAVYLARRSPDLAVALASAVGDDSASDALLALCHEERIDTSHVRRVAGAHLGTYRVQVNGAGERSFRYDRSETPYRDILADDDLLPDALGVDLLMFSGISLAVARGVGREALLRFAGDAGRPARWSPTTSTIVRRSGKVSTKRARGSNGSRRSPASCSLPSTTARTCSGAEPRRSWLPGWRRSVPSKPS